MRLEKKGDHFEKTVDSLNPDGKLLYKVRVFALASSQIFTCCAHELARRTDFLCDCDACCVYRLTSLQFQACSPWLTCVVCV